ncbi:hypothetical protein [Arthrobacter sp.]
MATIVAPDDEAPAPLPATPGTTARLQGLELDQVAVVRVMGRR